MNGKCKEWKYNEVAERMDYCGTSSVGVRNKLRTESISTTVPEEFKPFSTVEKLVKSIGDPLST